MEYIALDVHKAYSLARVEDQSGRLLTQQRIDHRKGAIGSFLASRPRGATVAVEATGNWYWVVDEIEAAQFQPALVNARLAKLMMGQVHKTDALDCRGLNRLQRTGTLPTVWIPPAAVRDRRELPRTRMMLVRQRTQLKNRIQATFNKHGVPLGPASDAFGRRGRQQLEAALAELPGETGYATGCLLAELDGLGERIAALEARIEAVFAPTSETELLRTMPGIAKILSVVIAGEIGDIARFGRAEALASYSGLVPRVEASGGKVRFGATPRQANHTLRWAFVEAANAALLAARRSHRDQHVLALYQRLRARRGHGKAIVAVARHLAEACFWVLSRKVPYEDPTTRTRR